MFGDYGLAWALKSQFIKGYTRLGLSKIEKPTFDIGHTNSYYDINMRKNEFSKESVWMHNAKNKTLKRLSFVYSCDTSTESHGKQGVIKGIKFFFTSMKKCKNNPMGPLVVEHLKDHALSLYEYLLKRKSNEELVAADITADIDKHFRAGFAVHWDDYLNHWMVYYNIIRILKDHVGYSSWTDVPSKQRALCYRNHNKNVTLPEWDTEQEIY